MLTKTTTPQQYDASQLHNAQACGSTGMAADAGAVLAAANTYSLVFRSYCSLGSCKIQVQTEVSHRRTMRYVPVYCRGQERQQQNYGQAQAIRSMTWEAQHSRGVNKPSQTSRYQCVTGKGRLIAELTVGYRPRGSKPKSPGV